MRLEKTPIYNFWARNCDARSRTSLQAGRWATEDMITVGNRFIERMYFKVREGVANGDIEPRYINTKLNVADVLTKAASREVVTLMQKILSGEEPWPEIPDSETALRIQIADMQRRESLGMRHQMGPAW